MRLKVDSHPPDLTGFIHAPRLEARLRGVARTATGVAVRVYTSADQTGRAPKDEVEGFMALAVADLPGGGYFSAVPNLQPQRGAPTLFGAPTSLWLGLSGALIAVLAVYGAVRELRPLRRLAGALDTFTGVAPTGSPVLAGAPEVRALAAAIDAMQHRVSDLMRERTIMIGAVAHDLRTLLTRMQLRILTLEDEAVQARFAADLDAMNKLIEDALAFARGVDVKLVRRPLDLSDLVATEVAEREALGGGLPIQADLSDAFVDGDAAALRRVVANLIDNAMRFGRSRVWVTALAEGDHVRLSVEDDGPGVPVGDRELVLTPFYRVESSRSRSTGGVGLGLAIASRIVEAHGGSIAVGASERGGALATVVLPGSRPA